MPISIVISHSESEDEYDGNDYKEPSSSHIHDESSADDSGLFFTRVAGHGPKKPPLRQSPAARRAAGPAVTNGLHDFHDDVIIDGADGDSGPFFSRINRKASNKILRHAASRPREYYELDDEQSEISDITSPNAEIELRKKEVIHETNLLRLEKPVAITGTQSLSKTTDGEGIIDTLPLPHKITQRCTQNPYSKHLDDENIVQSRKKVKCWARLVFIVIVLLIASSAVAVAIYVMGRSSSPPNIQGTLGDANDGNKDKDTGKQQETDEHIIIPTPPSPGAKTAPPTPRPNTAPPTPYPTPSHSLIPIGTPIVGSTSNELFGYSLSLSENGRRLAVGTPYHDGPAGRNTGMAQVFEMQNGNAWGQIGATIYGDGSNDWVGWSVPLSSDGGWMAINGGLNTDPYVKVFQLDENQDNNNKWLQRGATVKGQTNGFGVSLAISKYANTLAVGSRKIARVYKYNLDSDSWKPVGDDLEEDLFAYVALSGDGQHVAVGSPGYDSNDAVNIGRVSVFKVDAKLNKLDQLGEEIIGNTSGDNFGHSLSISYDGKTVAAGTFTSNYVKIVKYNDITGKWETKGNEIVGEALDNQFGFSLSLSEDAERIVVGSSLYGGDYSGRAIVYEYENQQKSRNRAYNHMSPSNSNQDKQYTWVPIGGAVKGQQQDQDAYAVSMAGQGNYFAISALKASEDGLKDNGRVRLFSIIKN